MKGHRIVSTILAAAGLVLPVGITMEILSHVGLSRVSAPPSTGAGGSASPPGRRGGPPSSGGQRPSGSFSGPVVQGMFGPVQARITVLGGRITNIAISAPKDNPTSQYINSIAVPLLRKETLRVQSANINAVSGATVTSEAYYQSLVSALKKAHIA